jgi:hypothetical protein
VMVENLDVKLGQEFGEAQAFLAYDLLQRIPKRHFQPDGRAMPPDPERSGLRFIVALRLVCEQTTHGISSELFYNFSKRYTRSPEATMFRAPGGVSFSACRDPNRGHLSLGPEPDSVTPDRVCFSQATITLQQENPDVLV